MYPYTSDLLFLDACHPPASSLPPALTAVSTPLWGRAWRNHQVVCHCDNQVVVACLHSRSSKHKGLMHLLRNLAFIEASHGFHLMPLYINTHTNYLADYLSRNRVLSFLSKVCPYPTLVPRDGISLLLDPRANWTSRRWQARFRDTLLKA